jgi:acyl-CoA dehydrogenase
VLEELAALGYPGVQDAFGFILSLAIPPVVKYAEESLKQKVIMEVTKGEKIICLAITDPLYGSDVANLTCNAQKSPCGQFYIVNGIKKWITTGM